MQSNPQVNFEKNTPQTEISRAATEALRVMRAAVANADRGLANAMPKEVLTAPVVDPSPVQDSYSNYADFEAYRRRNELVQPVEPVQTQPEQPKITDEPDNLSAIRGQLDAIYDDLNNERLSDAA